MSERLHRYPPLAVIIVALMLAVFALPSALNLPQANPGQTLEYAPVPGDSGTNPGGNLAGLGLGSSTTGPGGSSGTSTPPPLSQLSGNATTPPSDKQCVGNPPRQTEDPLSPPCVAFYAGNNGGATYEGVTGNEIRVLMYLEGTACGACPNGGQGPQDTGSSGAETRPSGKTYDLGQAPQPGEPYHVVAARLWQAYFNARYQTYNRHVHFFVQYSTDYSDDSKINADAAEDERSIHPFAVVFPDQKEDQIDGVMTKFAKAMANFGVLSFGGSQPLAASFYSAYPGRIWSYLPSTDQQAQQFASWVCSKVVGKPSSLNPVSQNSPRKLGIIYPSAVHTDPRPQPGNGQVGDDAGHAYGVQVQQDVERCSGNPNIFGHDVGQIDVSGGIEIGQYTRGDATVRMHNFMQDGVTTVVWAGGYEDDDTNAASSIGYQPEWIVSGDGNLDDLVASRYQDQTEWSRAWVLTDQPLDPPWQQTVCYAAVKETDPGFPDSDTSIPCRMYRDYRLFFTAVQVAGPTLDPSHVDQGLHAIPGVQTSDPQVPACFFVTGDYTCVKDSIAMWWDATKTSPYSQGPGCYRVPYNGTRYLPGHWPGGNVDAQKNAGADPCNGYVEGTFADPSGAGPGAPPGQ